MSQWFARLQRPQESLEWKDDFSGGFYSEDDNLLTLYERLKPRGDAAPKINYRIVDLQGTVVWQWIRSESPDPPPLITPPNYQPQQERPSRRFRSRRS